MEEPLLDVSQVLSRDTFSKQNASSFLLPTGIPGVALSRKTSPSLVESLRPATACLSPGGDQRQRKTPKYLAV